MTALHARAGYHEALSRLNDRHLLRNLSYVGGCWIAGKAGKNFEVTDPASAATLGWVTSLDGRSLKTERLHATGSVAVPLTTVDRRSKFADCLGWAGLEAEVVHDAFLNFEDTASLKDVLNDFE